MKVIPEPEEPPFAGIDERALARGVPFEQHVALEHGGEDCPRLLQKDQRPVAAIGTRPGDERRVRLLPPLDGHAMDPTAFADASVRNAFERRLGDVADAACRLGIAYVDEAAELSERPSAPKRDVGDRRERNQQAKLELDSDEGRELEEPGARCGAKEEI